MDGKGENMIWFMVLQMASTLVELIQLRRTSAGDKELEILLLRRQLAIYERKQRPVGVIWCIRDRFSSQDRYKHPINLN